MALRVKEGLGTEKQSLEGVLGKGDKGREWQQCLDSRHAAKAKSADIAFKRFQVARATTERHEHVFVALRMASGRPSGKQETTANVC